MVKIERYKSSEVDLYYKVHTVSPEEGQGAWLERTRGFCIYSESVIKIFDLQLGVCDDEYERMRECREELDLKWWQKILRFISFGYLYSNRIRLYATICDKDKLNFWQKAINFISFGYFYPTTARIELKPMSKYSVRFKYSSSFNGKPVLWKFKKKSSEIEGKWVKCADLPDFSPTKEIEEYVGLNDPVNTGEPRENKDITHEKHFLAWGNSSGPKLNQNVPVPLCIQQNMLNSDKRLDKDKKDV